MIKGRRIGVALGLLALGQTLPMMAQEGSLSLASGASRLPPASVGQGNGWLNAAPSRTVTDGALRRVVLARLRPEMPLFQAPALISTGFSGTLALRPILPAEDRAAARGKPDYDFINPDGVVASLTDINGYGFAPNGAEVTRPARDRLYAREIGQVFGATSDDAAAPNLYLTATSAYGLQITGPDRDGDLLPDRLQQGEPQAQWMIGQWGFDPLSGPGSVWKVDGLTGQVSLFATITTQGQANSGPGLGNIAFDATHQQLFVSDLQSGLIHRLDLTGHDLEQFDHGLAARSHAGLPPRPDDAAMRVALTDFAFDPLAPDSWGFADPLRRVWGLALHEGRLYYSVASSAEQRPEVWSVALDPASGGFTPDSRRELGLDEARPAYEISDIGFAPDGAMLLAQRGPRAPSFDYSQFTQGGSAEVLRYAPDAAQGWAPVSDHYAVGFAGALTNTSGGLALGPGYDARGQLDYSDCAATLWTSGENLRGAEALATELTAGGRLGVDGAQAQPLSRTYDQNAPPWISYALDFDATYPETARGGEIGDVAIWGCDPTPPKPTPKPVACAISSVALHCDRQLGLYIAEISVKPRALPPARLRLSDPAGQMAGLPLDLAFARQISLPINGFAAGQIGQIALCGYDPSDGSPVDCCKTEVSFTTPAQACKKVDN
jgi:hypothetical protein